MKHSKALELQNHLEDIQRLAKVLDPLIDEGRDEFSEFCASLNSILSQISPTYTVAVAGPVGSGKSTFLSSLLKEAGSHPITSISPTNETFAPMTICYGAHESLIVQYFGVDVVHQIQEHLASLERDGTKPHLVAQYRELRILLQKVPEVLAGEGNREVVRQISLEGLSRSSLARKIREHIAHSSQRADVYGIYKVELAYPGSILRRLRNVRFTDLYGFSEPSPLVKIKFDRFLSDEDIDIIIYVFPDLSITEDFNRLFDISSFVDRVVATGRLFLVLNKADAYTDANVSAWPRVQHNFRESLSKHVPALRSYIKRIPIFVLSAASIDGAIHHSSAREVRKHSIVNLRSIRSKIKGLSEDLENTSADLSLHLGLLFDLLGGLDVLAHGVEWNLELLQEQLPEISRLIDQVEDQHSTFVKQKVERLEHFRAALEEELLNHLVAIDYTAKIDLYAADLQFGESKRLFRSMLDVAQKSCQSVFNQNLTKIFINIGLSVDRQLLQAYSEYVSRQDEATLTEAQRLPVGQKQQIRPLHTTVEHSAREFMNFSQHIRLHFTARDLFDRFSNWFLRNKGEWNADRNLSVAQAKEQIRINVERSVETFMMVYLSENPALAPAYYPQICVGGERTYWGALKEHIKRLDDVLEDQVKITNWRFGLYKNRRFFVSNRAEYEKTLQSILAKKEQAEALIVELA